MVVVPVVVPDVDVELVGPKVPTGGVVLVVAPVVVVGVELVGVMVPTGSVVGVVVGVVPPVVVLVVLGELVGLIVPTGGWLVVVPPLVVVSGVPPLGAVVTEVVSLVELLPPGSDSAGK